jgi:hypothetical protein
MPLLQAAMPAQLPPVGGLVVGIEAEVVLVVVVVIVVREVVTGTAVVEVGA